MPTVTALPVRPDLRDLLGWAMLDHFTSGRDIPVRVWINGRRDEDMMPSVFLRNYSRMRSWERQALALARGSVLDIGAGGGCHSLLLQKRGLDVLALERSPLACQVMRDRGIARVEQGDIFDLKGISFDTLLMLMNGLGMAGNEKDTLRLFRTLRRLLARGGQILGDSTDILYARMDAQGAFPGTDGYYGEVEFRLEYRGHRSEPFRWLYLDPALLAELSDKAGLQCEILTRSPGAHYLARLTA